ncbi:MAG: NAD-dependent malic enzyme, partial [Halieaceae bacterium]|nr:NAD-dependent malic enzyme [Halieaceae bacterium]
MTNQSNEGLPRGVKLLHDPVRNKGTAFTDAERDLLGLRGLLPPRVCSATDQEQRVLEILRNKDNDLERFFFIITAHTEIYTLFYRVVLQ